MKLCESIFRFAESTNRFCSKAALRVFGGLWHWQSRRSAGLRFAVGFVGLALILTGCAFLLDGAYIKWAGFDETFVRYLENAGHIALAHDLSLLCAGAAALCLLAAVAALVRTRFSFRLMQLAWTAGAGMMWLTFRWTVKAADILNLADHKAFDAAMRDNLWTGSFLVGFFASAWPLILLVALLSTAARRRFGLNTHPFGGARDVGGDIVDAARTTTGDRRWKSSLYWTFTIFLVVLFLPYLIFFWGWEDPYGLPQGGGEMVQQVVKVKKIKKKKQKKLMVNPWSPYILERMNIDDVKTLTELEEESRDTYQATAATGGGKGKGSGGWPKGIGGNIRFIRLKYRGGDWDQDMGKGADYNLLVKFQQWTGMKVAKDTEFREIERLKFFPHKAAPPFVFLTGMKGLSISDKEAKILRDYCLVEGGMLFIDNGGGSFDGSVRQMLRKVFPGRSLVDIPNDDPIYQRPYIFPDGAPPFWHHAGYRALGVRDEGRWVVFYHPGDINDAWKDGHSGASEEVADQAYKLGVNVMFYAFNQYYRRWYEQD